MQPVTPENYIRAETDRNFHNIAAMAGGVNRFVHFRAPTPLDRQTIVRMNRDTLYTGAIIDTADGASITLPQAKGGRFISAMVVDNDHYTPNVFYAPGEHPLVSDTRYVMVAVRIQLSNPDDAAEVAEINALQDQLLITAASAEPLPPMAWEPESLKALTAQYETEARALTSFNGMFGPRGTVDEARRHLAAAAAWGGQPERDATYFFYAGDHDANRCHRATFNVPENNAFWSVTVYGEHGYIKSDRIIVNSSKVELNADGTFTVYFGSQERCGDVPNRIDITPGWNYALRIYLPGQSVLEGRYALPPIEPCS